MIKQKKENLIENLDNITKKNFTTKLYLDTLRLFFTDKAYLSITIAYSCGLATGSFMSELISEIFSTFGYDQVILAEFMPFSMIVAILVTIIYSKCCIKLPNQLLICERIIAIALINSTLLSFFQYLKLPIYIPILCVYIQITISVLGSVIINEEMIKYCNLAFPNNIVYATGALSIFQLPIDLVMNTFLGKFLDYKEREWPLLVMLIVC